MKLFANDSMYEKYEISIITEEVGFSSSNMFSSAFKKVINTSSSIYFKGLEEISEETVIIGSLP